MKPRKIKYSPEFVKSLARLPKNQLKNLATKEKIFLQNPFHPLLRTHKLGGKLEGFYAFSVSYHWRIVFHFKGRDIVFDAVGTHAVYR